MLNDDGKPIAKKPLMGLVPNTDDFSIDIPETTPDDTDERRKKSVTKSRQWKEWKQFALDRKKQYQQFIPGVNPAITKSDDNWRIADLVCREIDALIAFMEN